MRETKRFLALFLSMLLVYLPMAAQTQAGMPEAEVERLINSSFRDLFSVLDEDSHFDEALLLKAEKELEARFEKEAEPFKKEKEGLEKRIDEIRGERKAVHKAMSKDKVVYERLLKECEKKKAAGEDIGKVEEQLKAIEIADAENRQKSLALKREIDGDTSFDYIAAWLELQDLQEEPDSAKEGVGETTKELGRKIRELESKMENAAGLKQKAWNAKIRIFLLEVKYSHMAVKLGMLSRWPQKIRQINDTIVAGKQDERHKYANVEDIGDLKKRKTDKKKVAKILPMLISKNSEIQIGKEIADQVRQAYKIYPPESPIAKFVDRVGQNLVRNSDDWCPFFFHVIADRPGQEEINAFALPGGQVFINDSLILALKSEGELAGVIAHEISHVNARHAAHRASAMQWTQYAIIVGMLTGVIPLYGAGGYGAYQGLGFLMSLEALGITKQSESEADLLGAQILWNTGYDPRSEIDAFDRLAKYRNLSAASFWNSHPSEPDRMEKVEEEYRYLPPKESYFLDSGEYAQIRRAILEARKVFAEDLKKEEKDKPSLCPERKGGCPKEGEGGPKDEEPSPPVLKRKPPETKEK